MGILESLNSLAMIFIMIVPGFIFAKKNMLSEEQSLGITSVVVNLTWPCLVIDAMQIPFSKEILGNCGYAFVVMTVIFILALVISIGLVRVLKMERARRYLFTFMIIFGNTGFIGIPIINALYGKDALFYASIVEMVNDVFLFTVGIMLIQMSAGQQKKMEISGLLTPGMAGVVIGFLLFLFDFQLPGFIGDSIGIIGGATTPLSMLAIGFQIGKMNFKEIFGDVSIYVFSFAKLIVIPAIVFVIMVVLLKDVSLLAKVIILEFAMPTAACTTIFSQQYGSDVGFATKGVLVSTLFSIATLPIFTILLSFF